MWNKRLRLALTQIFLITIFFGISFNDASAGRKALVIGVSEYENLNSLAQPPEDARLMKESLEQFGFEVNLVSRTNIKDIKDATVTFIRSLEREDEGVFYFSGHGAQMENDNYLFGTDSYLDERSSVLEFDSNGLNVTTVLGDMKSKAAVAIIFLDSCRNIVYPGGKSLGQSKAGFTFKQIDLQDEYASFIGFSSQENTRSFTGDGTASPFTIALLAALNDESLASQPLPELYTHVKNEVARSTDNGQIPDYRNLLGNREFRFLTRHRDNYEDNSLPSTPQLPLSQNQNYLLSNQPVELTLFQENMVVTQASPLRSEPNLKADLSGEVYAGQPIQTLARTTDEIWYQVRIDQEIAYLPSNFLEELEPIQKVMIVVTESPLRSAPSFMADLAGDVDEGQAVQVTAKVATEDWYQITSSGNRFTYLHADSLMEFESIEKEMIVTKAAQIRYTPVLNSRIQDEVQEGTVVQVSGISKTQDWYQVKHSEDDIVYLPVDRLLEFEFERLSKQMIVMETAQIRYTPVLNSRIQDEVQEGTVVQVSGISKTQDWYQVKHSEDDIVYLPVDRLLEFEPLSKRMIVVASVNSRRSPNLEANSAVELIGGQLLEVLGQTNGWFLIKQDNEIGYLQSEHLVEYEDYSRVEIVLEPLTIWSSPHLIRSKKFATNDFVGQEIEIVGRMESWFRIRYGENFAFIQSDSGLVEFKKFRRIRKVALHTTSGREYPHLDAPNLATIAKNKIIYVNGEAGNWYQAYIPDDEILKMFFVEKRSVRDRECKREEKLFEERKTQEIYIGDRKFSSANKKKKCKKAHIKYLKRKCISIAASADEVSTRGSIINNSTVTNISGTMDWSWNWSSCAYENLKGICNFTERKIKYKTICS